MWLFRRNFQRLVREAFHILHHTLFVWCMPPIACAGLEKPCNTDDNSVFESLVYCTVQQCTSLSLSAQPPCSLLASMCILLIPLFAFNLLFVAHMLTLLVHRLPLVYQSFNHVGGVAHYLPLVTYCGCVSLNTLQR